MAILSNVIVFIWLIPLGLNIVLPLLLLVAYLLVRFIYFMLFPHRLRGKKKKTDLPQALMGKIP